MDHASVRSDGLPLRGGVLVQGLVEEVSWSEVRLWNASDYKQAEPGNWTFQTLLSDSSMGDIGDAQASKQPSDRTCSIAVELDLNAALPEADGDGGDPEAETAVRKSRDAAEVPASAGVEGSHVQGSTTCHAAVCTPTKASSVKDGNAILIPCPSVSESQEDGEFGAQQPSKDCPVLGFPLVPDSKHGGDEAVAQVPALSTTPIPQLDGSVGPSADPSLPPSFVLKTEDVNTEGGNNSSSWLQTPQGRGKALVRRGRPRSWSAESRDEICKRMKIHELVNGASPSTATTVVNAPPPSSSESAFSEVGAGKPNTPVLEAALLAAVATSGEEHRHILATTTEHHVNSRIEIPANAPGVTQCRGTTLTKKQCTHNVKDGSGFCAKHATKTNADHGSSRGVPYYKQPDIIVFRCRGKIANGDQCSHNVKDGGVYCLKHEDQGNGPPSRRIEDGAAYLSAVQPEAPLPTPSQVHVAAPGQEQAPIIGPSSPHEDDEEGVRCGARTLRNEALCAFKPKSGSVLCERHTRKFREMGWDFDVTYDTPTSISPSSASLSLRQRRSTGVSVDKSLLKAKELYSEILNARLLRGKVVSVLGREVIQLICEEATKDALIAESLLRFLAEEKQTLRKALIEDCKNLPVLKPPHFWSTKYSPNLARPRSEIVDTPEVCSKGARNDALQEKLLGRISSDANGASGSCSSFAPMSMEHESSRDLLTCGLCTRKFPEMPSLGRHWREDHKKEAFLFQKGMACSECGHEYTNKGGLLRHWKSTHPTLPIGDFLIVCMMCDGKFMDFHQLWMHVEARHYLEFSSAEFAQQVRNGVLGATVEVQHWSAQEVPGECPNSEDCGLKFKCRFCGQRFLLLPDLGRHHQADHGAKSKSKRHSPDVEVKQPPLVTRTPSPHLEALNSPSGKMLPLADVFASQSGDPRNSVEWPEPNAHPQALNFRHLKNIARVRKRNQEQTMNATAAPVAPVIAPQAMVPQVAASQVVAIQVLASRTFAPEVLPPQMIATEVIALKTRRRRRKKTESLPNEMLVPEPVPMKKRLGRPPKRIVEHTTAIQQERYGASEMPLQRASNTNGLPSTAGMVLNTTGWPSIAEILHAASVACCKESWYRELAKKHSCLHPDLHIQAMSLFTVRMPDIQWLVDSFRCPNQCLPFHVVHKPASPPAPAPAPAPALEVDMAGFSEAPIKTAADHVTDTGLRPAPRAAPVGGDTNLSVEAGKVRVINKDLSNGQEPVPIPCVIDEGDLKPCSCPQCTGNLKNPSLDSFEPWKCFRYTNKRLLDPSLGLDTESSKLGCACGQGKCDSGKCEHVVMFDLDNEDALDKSGVAIKGRFPYDEQGRIILQEGAMVYECNSSCSCHEDCQNRVLQKGVRVKLQVFKSRHKGWAVRAAELIPCGTFVCEYIGEVVNDKEANERGVRYDSEGCSYLYDIDPHLDLGGSRAGAKPFVIDATKHGNVARFINHSCAPNLINYEVLVESMDCQLAHIGFFARRDIAAGEELAYNYRYKLLPGKGVTCHCGAATCRGRLY